MVLMLCAWAMWKAQATIRIIAPGFSPEKVALTVPLLRILMRSFFSFQAARY